MGAFETDQDQQKAIEQVVGYLNFSSGAPDAVFTRNLDGLFAESDCDEPPVYESVLNRLIAATEKLKHAENGAFRSTDQAEQVLHLALERVIPEYLQHHEALLFHQSQDLLLNSFFVAKVLQVILRSSDSLGQADRIVKDTIATLNDFLGHRPVATLESQKIEPYDHEWICPIPVYLNDVGAVSGPYHKIVEVAIKLLSQTNPVILRAAKFSLERMQELAIDPRAFDFDHPINKRPNYHFGQWDEHRIGQSGFFTRFIIHQVTLDALLDRVARDTESGGDEEELMFEAAAVLACTMLMASGISGSGPGTYDSNTTLSGLLPVIAGYRDQFYDELLGQLPKQHRERLLNEVQTRKQPFGSVRQDLNRQLAKRRAAQLVNCRLASIFARMGFSDAAVEQSLVVPVASSRILCQIDCLLSTAKQTAQQKKLAEAFEIIPRVMSLVQTGVECGAIVDPWNILGFDGNYSLFPANENTVPDHRVYELVDLVERIMGMCSLIWSESAAVNDRATCDAIRKEFSDIVAWWRKYAPHEVMAVDAVDPEEIFSAAELVAEALNLWHQGGAATGDIEFWRLHADLFDSPKAYHLVIEALMDRGDFQTSSALLVHWLSQADFVRLHHGDSSFHNLMWRWITQQKQLLITADCEKRNEIWNRIRKFFDFVEANSEAYGEVPTFELGRQFRGASGQRGEEEVEMFEELDEFNEDSDDESELFDAAYEGVTYRDTTDDGHEGAVFGNDETTDDELEAEVDRLFDRIEYLATIANFWRIAATFPLPVSNGKQLDESTVKQLENRRDILANWIKIAVDHRDKLKVLLKSVDSYKIPASGVDQESLMQYDKHRLYKDSLLERIVMTSVESQRAIGMLAAGMTAVDHLVRPPVTMPAVVQDKQAQVSLFAAVLLSDIELVQERFGTFIEFLKTQPLLHVPMSRGGKPEELVHTRVLRDEILDLADSLPILGLFVQTHELVFTALMTERNQRTASVAVSEFDDLFKVSYTSMVKCLIQSTKLFQHRLEAAGEVESEEAKEEAEAVLFDCLDTVTDSMMVAWLMHSETLRLSVIEKLNDDPSWKRLVDFVQRYGDGLFTQHFLQKPNARAILYQGVDVWLDKVRNAYDDLDLRLFDELDKAVSKEDAVKALTLILEVVCENYSAYRDFNETTTQSDNGSLLYNLFDFLRLGARYDRVCWKLKPIVWGHEILVRDGQNSVARLWRRSLNEQVGSKADKYLQRFKELQHTYSIQMSSIERKLEGRFIHPLQIGRLRSLVQPAMSNPESRSSKRVFEKLQQETQAFMKATPGVGIDLPEWLAALENEVQQFHLPLRLRSRDREQTLIYPIDIPISRLREQLQQLPSRES